MSNKYDEWAKEAEKQEIEEAREAYYNGSKHFYREKYSAFIMFYAFFITAFIFIIYGLIQFIQCIIS